MKEKFRNFMRDRYGIDQLTIFLTYFGVFLLLILSIFKKGGWNWISLVIVIVAYLRVFSKDKSKRYQENAKYLQTKINIKNFFVRLKRRTVGTKTHKYFTCSNCKTELRVPKKKGKIKIKCPKCGKEYIMRT